MHRSRDPNKLTHCTWANKLHALIKRPKQTHTLHMGKQDTCTNQETHSNQESQTNSHAGHGQTRHMHRSRDPGCNQESQTNSHAGHGQTRHMHRSRDPDSNQESQTHMLDMLFRRMWKRLLRLIDGEAVVLRTPTSPPTTDPPPWPVRTSRLNTCGFSMYVHPLWTPTWTGENKPLLIIITMINLWGKNVLCVVTSGIHGRIQNNSWTFSAPRCSSDQLKNSFFIPRASEWNYMQVTATGHALSEERFKTFITAKK